MTRRPSFPTRIAAGLAAAAIELFARLITAVRGDWQGVEPVPGLRVYYANHASNGDFVLIWAVLPKRLRNRVRPVAGADYWLGTKIKRFIGRHVFNAVLIDRVGGGPREAPVEQMAQALDEGSSLIIFPEGTRNLTDEVLLPFKTGLYHLAKARPDTDFVPVWIDNLNRVMPKGEVIPVPLLCKVTFGAPHRLNGDDRDAFLARTRDALLALAGDAA
ncbi:lysophospholipid acyltransferase family protein [Jannaschia donghaensis]|uniref:2-acyl-glycerophospho-ethanolamine acyltransferase n=1 Tax=Jannaschia donghaensis TaxID=420998 RepID=A0A0M6YHU7_9RHOB|nr:lysophospholipid acyltransferase family protein [Jannaschia donghaensis]CTQ49255.1 2-acyl-glycerophospho-ethanolamine acyltransferase [Jannaschia donghaensis]